MYSYYILILADREWNGSFAGKMPEMTGSYITEEQLKEFERLNLEKFNHLFKTTGLWIG